MHETLDHSGAYVIADFETDTGEITGLKLSTANSAGFIPLTVPRTMNVSEPYDKCDKCGLIQCGGGMITRTHNITE